MIKIVNIYYVKINLYLGMIETKKVGLILGQIKL